MARLPLAEKPGALLLLPGGQTHNRHSDHIAHYTRRITSDDSGRRCRKGDVTGTSTVLVQARGREQSVVCDAEVPHDARWNPCCCHASTE